VQTDARPDCEYLLLENPDPGSKLSGIMRNATLQENGTEPNARSLPGIDVLNTGYGDFELRFDPNKPDEVQKAKETITDMLKRGYAIFVRQGKETLRVRKFDVERNVYIIGSTPAEEVPIAETRATAVGRSAGG
jgi:hypothetical protein